MIFARRVVAIAGELEVEQIEGRGVYSTPSIDPASEMLNGGCKRDPHSAVES